MKNFRQAVLGMLAALICLVIVVGSLSLALAESRSITGQVEAPVGTPSSEYANILPELTAVAIEKTPTPAKVAAEEPSKTSWVVPTITLNVNVCTPPEGWSLIMVKVGDTLEILSENYGTTPDALMKANCLLTNKIIVGMSLYVPHQPTATSETACGAPSTWVYYTIRSGDTLYKISKMYGITVKELMEANCLVSNQIIAGKSILVPNVTPMPSPTKVAYTATALPSSTPMPSFTPLPSSTKQPSLTITMVPSLTPTPSSTPTATLTEVVPSVTPTPTTTPVPSPTPTPTLTSTATPTPTTTMTPTPTSTSSPFP
jgi:LysM repeat protein